MNKAIEPTNHARTTMRERGIREEWAETAIREPDWIVDDPDDPACERRFRAIPEHGNRILRVVVVETATEIRIVTAFFDRNACRP